MSPRSKDPAHLPPRAGGTLNSDIRISDRFDQGNGNGDPSVNPVLIAQNLYDALGSTIQPTARTSNLRRKDRSATQVKPVRRLPIQRISTFTLFILVTPRTVSSAPSSSAP